MFRLGEGLEIVTLMVAEDRMEAESIKELLIQQGIRSVLKENGADQHLRIIGGDSRDSLNGIEVIVSIKDIERAYHVLEEAGYFGELEDLTDEELEELALSMEEITGLEDEES